MSIQCRNCNTVAPIDKKPGFTKQLKALGWDCTKNSHGARYYCPSCVQAAFGEVMAIMAKGRVGAA